jgi:hypothetical protein
MTFSGDGISQIKKKRNKKKGGGCLTTPFGKVVRPTPFGGWLQTFGESYQTKFLITDDFTKNIV